MKKIYLLLALTLSLTSSAQNGGWLWAKSNDNDATSSGHAVAAAADGSIYAAGSFTGAQLTFGSDTYTNLGTLSQFYLAKYNADGAVQWSKSANANTGLSEISAIVVDEAGALFAAGRYTGTLTIDNLTLTSPDYSCFAAKFSADGSVEWLKQVGVAQWSTVSGIANYGDFIYIAGSYNGATMNFPSTVLNNNGESDVFVAKLDLEGNYYWADSFGGSGQDYASAVELDSFGNLYLTGSFSTSATFGGDTVNSNGFTDIFLIKYDNQEQPAWIKSYGGSQYDWAFSLAVDLTSNLYASYGYSNTVNFGGTQYTSQGYNDSAIIKYNSQGNIEWTKTMSGPSNEYAADITTDGSGNVYATGYSYSGNITFAGAGYTLPGVSSMFVARLNADGSLGWFTQAGEMDGTEGHGIALDILNNAVVTGYASNITFGSTTLDSGYNMFVSKYGPQALDAGKFDLPTVAVYPNPASDLLTIVGANNTTYNIYDVTGRTVANGETGNSAINVSSLPSGMYIVSINNTSIKFIKE